MSEGYEVPLSYRGDRHRKYNFSKIFGSPLFPEIIFFLNLGNEIFLDLRKIKRVNKTLK